MSQIQQLIDTLFPDGVEFKKMDEIFELLFIIDL